MEQAISLLLIIIAYLLGVLATAMYELYRIKWSITTGYIWGTWLSLIIYFITIDCYRLYNKLRNK